VSQRNEAQGHVTFETCAPRAYEDTSGFPLY
jgi:hypothetical protein